MCDFGIPIDTAFSNHSTWSSLVPSFDTLNTQTMRETSGPIFMETSEKLRSMISRTENINKKSLNIRSNGHLIVPDLVPLVWHQTIPCKKNKHVLKMENSGLTSLKVQYKLYRNQDADRFAPEKGTYRLYLEKKTSDEKEEKEIYELCNVNLEEYSKVRNVEVEILSVNRKFSSYKIVKIPFFFNQDKPLFIDENQYDLIFEVVSDSYHDHDIIIEKCSRDFETNDGLDYNIENHSITSHKATSDDKIMIDLDSAKISKIYFSIVGPSDLKYVIEKVKLYENDELLVDMSNSLSKGPGKLSNFGVIDKGKIVFGGMVELKKPRLEIIFSRSRPLSTPVHPVSRVPIHPDFPNEFDIKIEVEEVKLTAIVDLVEVKNINTWTAKSNSRWFGFF